MCSGRKRSSSVPSTEAGNRHSKANGVSVVSPVSRLMSAKYLMVRLLSKMLFFINTRSSSSYSSRFAISERIVLDIMATEDKVLILSECSGNPSIFLPILDAKDHTGSASKDVMASYVLSVDKISPN